MENNEIIKASFRDPAGFVYVKNKVLYRQVNNSYEVNYDHLMNSGLYSRLTKKRLLIEHEEVTTELKVTEAAAYVLQPKRVPFISYPYEWCFSQLKAAALATLEIQKIALENNMSLRDANAYNIQFVDGKPVLIDTLSFEKYREGMPWPAYRQFCQHFLAPLALMSNKDFRLGQLARVFIDGVPLELASKLLPLSTWFNLTLLLHIHLHAKSSSVGSVKNDSSIKSSSKPVNMLALIQSLYDGINKMSWSVPNSVWKDYYSELSYSESETELKKSTVSKYLDMCEGEFVWDFGSNTGMYSRIASEKKLFTVSWELEPECVEINYLEMVKNKNGNLLPLILDLSNPSPSLGWENAERDSLMERGGTDTILALALIHHIVISNNVPLNRVVEFFSRLCNNLIIEFVPKNDPMVQTLLESREDIFPDYTKEQFEKEFSTMFTLLEKKELTSTGRVLYLMTLKGLG